MLERIPRLPVLIGLMAFIVVSALLWQRDAARIVLALHAAMLILDWLSLEAVSGVGRSFGPVRPPLIALTTGRMIVTTLIGLLGRWGVVAGGIALSVQLAILLVALYGLWIEPFRLQVVRQTLSSPRFDPALPPVRILHLTDLHVERITCRERSLQTLIEQLSPDLIVFTGDFVNLSYNRDPLALADIREVTGRWHAPYGVYVVSGSPLVESQQLVEQIVAGTGLRWLRDEVVTVDVRGQRIAIIGVTCSYEIEEDCARLYHLAAQAPADSFRLLLYHTPELATAAADAGIALYLCGHTHGGQWRLPFYGALITSSRLGKRFEMGCYTVGDMRLYVSRGIGMEGASAPRARLLCPPEITLWTLTGQ